MAEARKDALCGAWVHSHEEDTASELVFRPASYPFPPARGRACFELRPDGTYVENSPGPVDLPETSTGSWWCDGNRLILSAAADLPGHAWELVTLDADRLIVKRSR